MYANPYVIYLALHTLTGNETTMKPNRCIKTISEESLVSGIVEKHPSG
jgi:hypothetical protein